MFKLPNISFFSIPNVCSILIRFPTQVTRWFMQTVLHARRQRKYCSIINLKPTRPQSSVECEVECVSKLNLPNKKRIKRKAKDMNFRLLTCHRRQDPKINVASRKSVKGSKKKSRTHKKSSTRQKRLHKPSYIASNLFSKNFYPANYFFQDDHQQPSRTRVGVNDHYGFLITARNPPQIPRKNYRMIQSHQQAAMFGVKVGYNRLFCH